MPSKNHKLEVLYEDNHLLVVNKPVLLPTMGVAADKPSLLSVAKEYIARKYNKPGNVYLGVVSRLDAPVSGVVLLARTSKAAARLSEQFRERTVEKVYWALVEGEIDPPAAELTHFLRKDERHRKVHTTSEKTPGATEARLSYELIKSVGQNSLVEVKPETGRKHQIRVQLAKVGHPILGDRKYGSRVKFPAGIALHSRRLVVCHPVRNERVEFEADVPPGWPRL